MSNGCRRCLTLKSGVTTAGDEVRRIARQMSRAATPSRLSVLKDHLAIAKANLTKAKDELDRGHECDTRLTDEHWSKRA